MWWFLFWVMLTSPFICECENVTSPEQLEFMLQGAAAEVYAMHADEMSRTSKSPPYFKMPAHFMRSFRPSTGVGNREELLVDSVLPLQVYAEVFFSSFLYKRFNNSDYVVGVSSDHVILHKMDPSSERYLVLSSGDAVFSFADEAAIVKDVVLFTRFTKYIEVLYLAILVESPKTAVIHVYEIVGDGGVVVSVIDMKMNHPSSSKSVKKIAYVQSSHGGSLVVLVNTGMKEGLSYKQKGNNELSHYIEVNYPSAIDLVTFTVHGHGYIAVANPTFCEIFKMNENVRGHLLFHRLGPLSNIVDLEYFRMGFHHFLAIADSRGQILYTWKSGEFAWKQEIAVPNVVQIYAATVESCRDEVVLLMITSDGNVNLHVFSGMTETFEALDAEFPEGHAIKPGTVTSFTYQSKVVILFSSLDNEIQAFVIRTSLNSLKDPLLAEGGKVSGIMKDIQNMLDSQTREIQRIKKILKSAIRSNGDQAINAVQYFTDISSTNETVVEDVNEFELKWEDSSLTLEDYKRGTDDLEKAVVDLENLINDIEKTMPDIVREDEDAVIRGQKTFTGTVIADTLKATSLTMQTVAGMNLAQLQKDVYRLDRPNIIEGTLTFTEPLTITGNLDVGRTVNGIDISEEVMTTDTAQTSQAQMFFENKLVVNGNLGVSGKVNEIDIGEEVVTLTGTHRITGHKNFLNGIQADGVTTKLLDGLDMDDLYQRALTISGKQDIIADTTFSSIATGNIVLHGKLNGYDVEELESNIVRVDKPATISGFKTFVNDVTVAGGLTVEGTVNGLRIPDDLFLTDQAQTVTGAKEFLGQVTALKVDVKQKIDGIKIPDDILTLSGDEEISSTLYFADGIVAEKDIVVEGLVDGVDISEIAREALKLNESNEFTHAVFLGPVNITGNLVVNGLVNKVKLDHLVKDIVYRDENPVVIKARKNFKKVTADEVKLDHTINGYNINIDFMKVRGDQIINGTKTFKRAVSFNSLYIDDGMIGGLNLTEIFQQRLKLAIDENYEIDNEIEFEGRVIVDGSLGVQGTINGLKIPDDVVLRNSQQEISNKHFAGRVIVDNLIVDGNVDVETFGGINLTKFYNERITLSSDQEIPGDIWIGNTTAGKVTITGLVNGKNFTDFASNVMSITKPQTVIAAKEFSGNVSVHGRITTSEGVNGFKLSDIKQRAFKLLEDNVVTTPLELKDNITINNLEVTGDINGVDITRLSEDSLKKVGTQYVGGDVIFNEGFHVVGDIVASTVNMLVIPEDVLLKSLDQAVKGQFTLGSAGIEGDLTVSGTVNGLDLSEVAPKLAKLQENSEVVIESNVTFSGPIHVGGNIEVTGTVNEVDLKQIFDSVLRKTGNQNITGNKVFRGNVTVVGDIDLESVNGINWKEFLDDVVWINIPQVVKSPKTFEHDVIVEKDVFVSGLVHAKLVNNMDLQKFVDEAVYVDEPANITGPILFKNAVEITGDMNTELINGLRLKTDVITIVCDDDGPQVITGQKSFPKLKVFGDIYADTVNSHDLQKLYDDTLLTEGNQTIYGRKVIYGDVVFKKNVYPDLVNGMILNRDLVTLDTVQKIEGPITFKGDVLVEKDMFVNGLINGIDLQNLSQEAVYLKTDQDIVGTYSFQNVVVSSDVKVVGTVNDVDLNAFDRNVTEFLRDTKDSLEIMDQYVQDHCEQAKYLQESLQNSYYALDSLIFHQELEFPASIVEVKSSQDISLVYLDDTATKATSVQTVWDDKRKDFYFANSSTSLIAKRLSYLIGNIQVVINIGISAKDSSIFIQGVPSNVQGGFSDASVVMRTQDAVIALLFPIKGICETYLVKEYPENHHSVELDASLAVGKDATSIAMFELANVLYLAVSSSRASPYYKRSSKVYSKKNGDWQKIQLIASSSSIVKHFAHQSYHYLVFVNNAPVYETREPKSIQIYRNSGPNELKFSLFQKVPFDDVIGIEVFQFGDLLQLHLVAWNETRIQIFGLEGESGMKSIFTLHGQCVKDVKPLLIGNDFFLVVGQQNLKTDDGVHSVLYKGLTKGFKYETYNLTYC